MMADLGTGAVAGANAFSGSGGPATNALGKYPASTAAAGPKAHGKNFKIDNGSTLNL